MATNVELASDSDRRGHTEQQEPTAPRATRDRKKRANMHEGIGVWHDVCPCEAEPRWVEVGEEMGINLSPYEDDEEDLEK